MEQTIRTLSEYQIKQLRVYFMSERVFEPFNIKIEYIARVDEDGSIIIGFISNGQTQRTNIPMEEPISSQYIKL
jgi:hypothetical protein